MAISASLNVSQLRKDALLAYEEIQSANTTFKNIWAFTRQEFGPGAAAARR